MCELAIEECQSVAKAITDTPYKGIDAKQISLGKTYIKLLKSWSGL